MFGNNIELYYYSEINDIDFLKIPMMQVDTDEKNDLPRFEKIFFPRIIRMLIDRVGKKANMYINEYENIKTNVTEINQLDMLMEQLSVTPLETDLSTLKSIKWCSDMISYFDKESALSDEKVAYIIKKFKNRLYQFKSPVIESYVRHRLKRIMFNNRYTDFDKVLIESLWYNR